MGIIHHNPDGFWATFGASGGWEALRQETLPYDQVVEVIPDNFSLDENCETATCDHCDDEFEVDKGLARLVNHLQNNHCDSILNSEGKIL